MSKVPPYALLLATLAAIVCVIIAGRPAIVVGLGAPALLLVFASGKGRRTFGGRLLVIAPLVCATVLLRWFEHAPARERLLPALRVVSAIAWSSALSTWHAPKELGKALRSLGAPLALVELIAHTRRFAGQLAETVREAWNAAALRGGLLSLQATLGTVGYVAGVIVVRAFDRAECVAIAGALRGAHLADERGVEAFRSAEDLGCPP
jgi:energy-coupling factor transporter transmembrane protein EcfT